MVMLVGILLGLVLIVGAAVDYSRAMAFKAALQNLADSAALAGASVYVSADTALNATTVATNYFNAGLPHLPDNISVGTPTITPSSDSAGYYIQVTVPTSRIRTTFLGLFTTSIAVEVSAKAKDPIVIGHVDFGGWTTEAYDGNTIYWYALPSDGSLPTFNTAHPNDPTYNRAFHAVFTNIQINPPSTSRSFTIAAAQRIGFALVNITGGRCPADGCTPYTNYGSNQYGGAFNSVHVFLSQVTPPNRNPYGYPAGPSCNASLLVAPVDPHNPYPTDPTHGAGTCQPAVPLPFAAPSCSQVGDNSYRFFWNDMGARADDFDFNDGVYNFNCTVTGGNIGVVLIE